MSRFTSCGKVLATAVVALLLLSGCPGGDTSGGGTSDGATSGGDTSGEDTSGGDTSGGDTSGGDTSGEDTSGGGALEEIKCPVEPYLQVVTTSGWLTTAVDACLTSTGDALLIKNDYPTVLVVTPANSWTAVGGVKPGRAIEDFRAELHYELATKNSYPGWHLVPPGGYVIAVTRSDEHPGVSVAIPVEAASQAYAAGIFAKYIESKVTPRSQKHAQSALECAEEAAEVWKHDPPRGQVNPADLLAQLALGPAVSCSRLVRDLAQEADGGPPPREQVLASELRTLGMEVKVTAFDDLRGLARRAVQLCGALPRC